MNAIIIYWSSTGNTLSMANKIGEDLSVKVVNVSDITSEEASKYDTIILGCPAMGAEELEDGEFRPFFDDLMNVIDKQRLFLFGSYGWGGGEWMRNWENEIKEANKNLGASGLISDGDASAIHEADYTNFIEAIRS